MMLSDGPTCAGAILARGQKNAEGRIGNTVEALDEPTRQKRPALRVAPWRPPATSPRLPDVSASRCARLLADWLARVQRRMGRS